MARIWKNRYYRYLWSCSLNAELSSLLSSAAMFLLYSTKYTILSRYPKTNHGVESESIHGLREN